MHLFCLQSSNSRPALVRAAASLCWAQIYPGWSTLYDPAGCSPVVVVVAVNASQQSLPREPLRSRLR